jgi:hypothetical protein
LRPLSNKTLPDDIQSRQPRAWRLFLWESVILSATHAVITHSSSFNA